MKAFIRALTPPLLWNAASAVWQSVRPREPRMFRGVHAGFAEVPDQGPWTSERYLAASRLLLRECQAGRLPPKSETTHAVLAVMLNMWPGSSAPKVLDWAGGTGIRYWATKPSLTRPVEWHVVDNPALAGLSHEVMGRSNELFFHEKLPPAGSAMFDVVIVYAALQFVEDQASLLTTLASYEPRLMLFPRIMARHGAAYVTRQRIHGSETPCKVSSLEEIASVLDRCGYRRFVQMPDGLDLSEYFEPDVRAEYRVGPEHWLAFQRVDRAS